ncbi:ATP-binding cassette, subfamily B [Chitinophaga costaii]|uniref:ATP-binding cassette, subfamily B n=1 Tax=Chitinophaga costaii TaxID=1335309 RepID=A0A1C4C8P8_9BACT|nr:ABC transporter ATP-binding protein [Chitinophaga costaii]PUZ27192.1 ABC transporter ATP-binding protein [Chitinophaga costaii]SCC15354.1 ATP-binding cassette, subfamily B [Chitinophaga costaii]
MAKEKKVSKPQGPSVFGLLKPYRNMVILLLVFSTATNGLTLSLPMLIRKSVNQFQTRPEAMSTLYWTFLGVSILVCLFAFAQGYLQTYTSEIVARNLRTQLSNKISRQSYAYIQQANPSRLLTNLTSDIDSIKMFVAQAVSSIVASLVTIIGASVLLITINWQLGLCVIGIIPIIAITFFIILGKVKALFRKSREIIDWLNKVINESILGAALVRVLNSWQLEYDKFTTPNIKARDLGLAILRLFSLLIPIVTLTANLAVLTILLEGGRSVILGSMDLGTFVAFNSYLAMLIFPIFVIGIMSNIISQSTVAYARVSGVLGAPETAPTGTYTATLQGNMALENVTVHYGEKRVLKNVSMQIKGGSRTAVIGPTAAGKTQLLHVLTALVKADEGQVFYDGKDINEYAQDELLRQIGLVFQDSIIFNMSLRENIAFSDTVTDESLEKAIRTAELYDYIQELPDGLSTIVSERGNSLSGGQKQRIMLARALAINPTILLLDDFTARVDTQTEQKILQNVRTYYPGITLLSVTQKIASVADYDQIILLMEGEVLATGTHETLLQTSHEYVQIFNSQRSTSNYELQS